MKLSIEILARVQGSSFWVQLAVQFLSGEMAVFDQSLEQADELSAKVMGSLEDLQTDSIAREELRTIRSNILAREIHFKE